jgi:hypothetical protein
MRYQVKNAIKYVLKSYAMGRKLYPAIQKYYQRYAIPRSQKRLHTYGYDVLKKFDDIATRHSISYFASYGTLLGFMRDGGFILHDNDIDFGIVAGQMTPVQLLNILLTQETGFEFVRALEFKSRITVVTIRYKKIIIDFFFYERDGDRTFVTSYYWEPTRDYPSARENSVRLIYQADVTELTKLRVHGADVSVPVNSEELLTSQYGHNWRVPDPNWSNENHPGIVKQREYGYSVELERVYELDARVGLPVS